MRQKYSFLIVITLLLVSFSCTTTKRKGDVSKLGKFYHNTTAQYNGYFNANELYLKSMYTLEEMHQDNYNQLLPLYPYRDVQEVSGVVPDLNLAIEKLSKVINLHRVSTWTDDCYLLLGQAQYLKQDFETAEKTFEYFVDEMNPAKLSVLKKQSVEEKPKKSSSRSKSKKSKKKSRKKASETKQAENAKPLDTGTSGGSLLSREPAYHEGLVWMGKTYVERERYPSAAYMINKLENSPVSKEVAREIPVLKSYFFIRQKKYAEAIQPLQQAIELAKKAEKARYAYVLAQIFELLENEKGAYKMYHLVLDNTSNYEMEFNARLNLYKNALGGDEPEASILKELDRLLKEEKYHEYKDQIYFTRAEIKFRQGDFGEAFKDYQLSLKNNLNNEALKGEVYYKLANRYFSEGKFLEAKLYYDSTRMFLPQTDDRFARVDKFVKNLNQIAINLSVIQLQDSLIRISQMPREDQEAIAMVIKKEREKIRKMQETGGSGSGGNRPGDAGIDRTNAGMDLSKVSTFFAYNDNTVRIGKLDFQRRWNDRELEDNWRRSNKAGSYSAVQEETGGGDSADELTDAEFKSILKDVPFAEKDRALADEKIKAAMLELGMLYRDKLENYQRSEDILEQLLQRYPGLEEECKALYYLHLSKKDLGKSEEADRVKSDMVVRYPDCSFTQVLTDPEFLAKQMKLLNKKENYYQDIYHQYNSGAYEEAIRLIENAGEDLLGDPVYAAKVDFLEALCLGNIEGRESYITGLDNLIKRYPNTPEEIKAKEILRFLKGDKQAFETLIYEEGLESFSLEADKLHYIFVVLYGADQEQLKEAKREISKYNTTYHKLDRLRISNIYLDTSDDVQIILVRKFDTKDGAMGYYYKLQTREGEFLPPGINFEVFAISQKNYREVIKQRTVNTYREFFAKEYLEEEK